nr:hypothetical protein [Tanacetum cinerariifolium]
MDVSKLSLITGYASNRIPATIDDVARMFDVSLNTIQELDGFAMQFQSNDLGSVLSKESTIDDVARMFDVSLNTIQELDGFAMQFQSNDLGSVLSKECADAIIKIVCEHNTTLKNVAKVKKSVGAMLDTSYVTNRQPNMATPKFSSETHDKQWEFVSVTSPLVSKLIDDVLTSSQIDEEEVAWSKPIDKDTPFATHTLFGFTYVNTSSSLDNMDVNHVKIDTPIVQSVDVGGQDNTKEELTHSSPVSSFQSACSAFNWIPASSYLHNNIFSR